ncbi:MAG: hypothetical protein ACJAVD_000289 [Porticoccaceae bacterium]|jgi:hypothetical protein
MSLFYFNIQAQSSADKKLGTWYMYNGSHKISDKIALKTMAHFRYFEVASEFQQEIYRFGINYSITPKINLTIGTSYATADVAYNSPSNNLYEYRFYEDLNVSSKWGKLIAKHRFRLEHRFIHKNSTQDATQSWIRYNLNLSTPISKKWSIYAFNELFLNLDRGNRFSQNWTGAGFLHQLNKNLKLKLGYFQIKLPNNTLKRLQLGVILNTNHTKKLNI